MYLSKRYLVALFFALNCVVASVQANTLTIPMELVAKGIVKDIGVVTATDTKYGLLLTPNLIGLPPGVHGFHIHEHPSCDDKAMAAGGHLDPKNTKRHLGPYNDQGHLGDLPALTVDSSGKETLPILAPRLTTSMISNHVLMVHIGGDNYSDIPEKLGGGKERIACGVIHGGSS